MKARQIAIEMMKDENIPEYIQAEIFERLADMEYLVNKMGGSIASRQIVAGVIVEILEERNQVMRKNSQQYV